MHKAIFNWSGGKDSALALHKVRQAGSPVSVERLLTSVNSSFRRVSMHGVREELLEAQASSIGLPLQKLLLPEQPGMEEYDQLMANTMLGLKQEGFTHTVFGDIFLEDLRQYREEKLSSQGFYAHFPLWKRDTTELLHEFLDLGFKTVLVCIKADLLDKSFAGRVIDRDFLKDLPSNVDPCGERGEYHTFVFDGPIFSKPILFTPGEILYREFETPKSVGSTVTATAPSSMGFWYCDLLPATC